MTLVTVFLFFTITSLGLGLITLARIYQKLGFHKVHGLKMGFAAENGAKQAFAALTAAIAGRSSPVEVTDWRLVELKEATAAGDIILAEELLGLEIPFEVAEAEGPQAWRSRFDLAPGFFEDRDEYFFAAFRGAVLSEGRLEADTRKKSATLEIELKILAGRIPLAYFPILLAGPEGRSVLDELIRRKQVEVLPGERRFVIPGPASTDEPLISADATAFLEKALQIKILSPDRLSRAELRRALGLEMVNEPVPDGVYLIANDAGLGGVFVQGDVAEMSLAAEAGWQFAQFKLEEGTWLLKFNPSLFKTVFQEPTGLRLFDRTPLPIIMVNGKILSLGGGTAGPDNSLTRTSDASVPCLLAGVSLTIVCADEITLTSHLVQEGVRWIDGIPYLKDSQSQLVIYATGRDFADGAELSGTIKVGAEAPRDLQIHASLAARKNFEAGKGAGDVLLAGGLQTSGLSLGTSKLRIVPDDRILSGAFPAEAVPRAAVPLLWILSLEPLEWRD
jgi:hypothetical protein